MPFIRSEKYEVLLVSPRNYFLYTPVSVRGSLSGLKHVAAPFLLMPCPDTQLIQITTSTRIAPRTVLWHVTRGVSHVLCGCCRLNLWSLVRRMRAGSGTHEHDHNGPHLCLEGISMCPYARFAAAAASRGHWNHGGALHRGACAQHDCGQGECGLPSEAACRWLSATCKMGCMFQGCTQPGQGQLMQHGLDSGLWAGPS